MKIIGLSGKAKSGKDTLADELVKRHRWTKYSLAAALKAKAVREFHFREDQVYGSEKDVIDRRYSVTPRQILIEMGQFYRKFDPNYWITALQRAMLDHPQAHTQIAVIADVRFINEAKWIKEHGGFMVRLNRPIEMRGMELDDNSETDLDNYVHFDLIVPESRNVDLADIPALAEFVHERVNQTYVA